MEKRFRPFSAEAVDSYQAMFLLIVNYVGRDFSGFNWHTLLSDDLAERTAKY